LACIARFYVQAFIRIPGRDRRMFLDGLPGLAALVERRLEEAAANGELSNLPGEGRPLDLSDDALVPPELRVAYRIVRNAGCVPPELAGISEVHRLIRAVELGETEPGSRRLRALLLQLEASGRHLTASGAWHDYQAALRRRLDRAASGGKPCTMAAVEQQRIDRGGGE
jgi:hypothetical protein